MISDIYYLSDRDLCFYHYFLFILLGVTIMDNSKSDAMAVIVNVYRGDKAMVPTIDISNTSHMQPRGNVKNLHNYRDDTCEVDVLRVTGTYPTPFLDVTVVAYNPHDFPAIYLYPTMADLPLSVINQLIDTNYTTMSVIGNRPVRTTDFPCERIATRNALTHEFTFCDGSAVAFGAGESSMFAPRTSQPNPNAAEVPASMFGGRVNEKSSIFGQSVEKSTEDEITSLRRELRELTGRYNKLEQFVYDNTPIEFLGLECYLMSKAPEFGYDDAIHLRGVSHRTRMFATQADKIYITHDGDWLEYRGDRSVVVDAWFKELFKNPFGLGAIREMGFFYYNGVRFDMLNSTLSEDIIMVHNFYGWDVCAGSIYNTVITDYGHGKGYVLIKDSTTGRVDTFSFSANKLDLSDLELSTEYVGRAKLPKVCGYAYTGSVLKSSTVWCVREARAAVRATIIQANRERLNYRRNNQMVIDRDFELERISDFPKYDFLPEMNSGELYRFKLMKSNITVYVYFNGTDNPQELHLGEVEAAKLDLIDGSTTACKLREHCTRLVKHYGLA